MDNTPPTVSIRRPPRPVTALPGLFVKRRPRRPIIRLRPCSYTRDMRPFGAIVASLVYCTGCSHPPTSVVGKWQAYLGTGRAAKLYYGRPEPTEIDFRDDNTYSVHLMWGDRSVAQTGGTYSLDGNRLTLNPREDLDPNVWPGKAETALDQAGRSFRLRLSRGSRVPEARFVRLSG